MNRSKLLRVAVSVAVSTLAISLAYGDNDDNDNKNPQAVPFVFVGTAPGCAPSSAGSNIVTSAWLSGMGLPDDNSSNTAATNRDPHFGLLLSKNGVTPDCSAAGATITGVSGMAITEIGFDFRNGTHCGAGAPRFNLTTQDNVLHFVGGCGNAAPTPAPQDPLQWSRVRFNLASATPPVLAGEKVKSLEIIFDEGTDTNGTQDPMGVGLAVIDNIDINGSLITSGPKGNGNGNGNGKGDKNNDH